MATVGCAGALLAAVVLLRTDGGPLGVQGRRAVRDASNSAIIWAVAAFAGAIVTAAILLDTPVDLLRLPARRRARRTRGQGPADHRHPGRRPGHRHPPGADLVGRRSRRTGSRRGAGSDRGRPRTRATSRTSSSPARRWSSTSSPRPPGSAGWPAWSATGGPVGTGCRWCSSGSTRSPSISSIAVLRQRPDQCGRPTGREGRRLRLDPRRPHLGRVRRPADRQDRSPSWF